MSKIKFCLISQLNTYGKWTIPGNEIRAWAYAFNGDVYCGLNINDYTYFDQYDITMVELTPSMLSVASNLKQQSKTKVVGLVEGELIPHWPYSMLAEYVQVLNLVDMVGVINEKALSIMRTLTNRPVHLIGIPYPLAWSKQNCNSNKQNIVELGNLNIGCGYIWNLSVFKRIDTDCVCYPLDTNDEIYIKKIVNNDKLVFRPIKDWNNYFIEHSQYHIGIHLDERATWGRFSLDCAAANIPCISTSGSHVQKILFPDLTVEYYEIDKAVSLYRKILNDNCFYQYVVDYANEQIKQFDLDPTKNRFLALI